MDEEKGEKVFWISLTSALILSTPLLCFGWIILVATVNWHDVLLVVTVIVIQYQTHMIRRNDKAFDRAVRRYQSRQAVIRMTSEPVDRTPFVA